MKVRDIMHTSVVTLHSSDRLNVAEDIMTTGRIRHLPVVLDPGSAGKDSMKPTTYGPTRFDVVADPVNLGFLTDHPEQAYRPVQQLFHLMGERSGA